MLRLWMTGVACVRGNRRIFHNLNFEVGAGQAVSVTGPNGSGKSSLLRVIAGFLRPAEGTIVLEGVSEENPISEQAHYLGHADALKPALTVAENLSFWARYFGGTGAPTPALEAVGLAGLAHLPAGYLSAGQRRRLSLGRLLAAPRPIWLLDEPLSSLDSAGQELLAAIMRKHMAGGGIIVAATHAPLGIGVGRVEMERHA